MAEMLANIWLPFYSSATTLPPPFVPLSFDVAGPFILSIIYGLVTWKPLA